MAATHTYHAWSNVPPPGPPLAGFSPHRADTSEVLAAAEYLAPGRASEVTPEAVRALRDYADHDVLLLRRAWKAAARECRRGVTRRAAVDLLWAALVSEDAN